MIERFIKYVNGYVKILLVGDSKERFLNLINARNIKIWDIVFNGEQITFYIESKNVKKLKIILRKTKTKIKVMERYGLPFFLFAYRKRKMFFLGLFVSWVIVYIMSLYVWNISFEGNFTHTDDELTKFLEDAGVKEGILKDDIDTTRIEKELRNEYFDITWASIEIKGTKVVIHIRENSSQYTENNEEEQVHGDIVCSKNAVITSIITRQGTPLVGPGDEVNNGDVLIQGKYQIIGDDLSVLEERPVKASGDVIGKVIYNVEFTMDREYTKKVYTGKESTSYIYDINGKQFTSCLYGNKYKKYDIITSYEQMKIGENFYLPVIMERKIYKEYEISKEIYTEEQAREVLDKKLQYILKKIEENTIQILENNVKIEVGNEECKVSGQVIALENIGSFGGTYE